MKLPQPRREKVFLWIQSCLNTRMRYKRRGALGTCGWSVNQPWVHTDLSGNLCNKEAPNGNVPVICWEMLCVVSFSPSHWKYLFGVQSLYCCLSIAILNNQFCLNEHTTAEGEETIFIVRLCVSIQSPSQGLRYSCPAERRGRLWNNPKPEQKTLVPVPVQ